MICAFYYCCITSFDFLLLRRGQLSFLISKSDSILCNVDEVNQDNQIGEDEESKLPLQLAIVGRPNVGKSTLLNVILQEDRVLVGPEAGLTRDSVRAQVQFQGRTIFMVYLCSSCFRFIFKVLFLFSLMFHVHYEVPANVIASLHESIY